MFDRIQKQAESALRELLEVSKLRPGDLLVIGCSSSEIMGERIGKGSSMEAAQAVYDGIDHETRKNRYCVRLRKLV